MSGTNLGRMPILIVSLVIGIVMATTAIVPLVSDYSDAKTFTNEGYFNMSNTEDETVIQWTPSVDPYTVKVNNVDVSLNSLTTAGNSSYSIAFASDFIVRYYYESSSSQNIQIWTSAYQAGIGSSSANTGIITINSSGVSFTTNAEGATTTNVTHSGDYFVLDPEGEYTMKLRGSNAYLLEDTSIVYAGGISNITSSSYTGLYFEGKVGNYTFSPMNQYVTVSNPNSVYTEVDGYVDLISLEKVTFTTTYSPLNDDPTVRDQTYNYFLVPAEVTADPDNPDSYKALVKVIPVMAFVALIAAAAYMIYSKRD